MTVRTTSKKKIFDKGDALKTSKTLYTIVEKVGKRYKLKNITTGNDIKRLYPHFELVLNNYQETIPTAVTPSEPTQSEEEINPPAKSTAEPQKFIGETPVKSRKGRKPVEVQEVQKFIGETPVKSRKSRKRSPSASEQFH